MMHLLCILSIIICYFIFYTCWCQYPPYPVGNQPTLHNIYFSTQSHVRHDFLSTLPMYMLLTPTTEFFYSNFAITSLIFIPPKQSYMNAKFIIPDACKTNSSSAIIDKVFKTCFECVLKYLTIPIISKSAMIFITIPQLLTYLYLRLYLYHIQSLVATVHH
jgi:hypothetical protein